MEKPLKLTNYDVGDADKSTDVEVTDRKSIVGNNMKLTVCFGRYLLYTSKLYSYMQYIKGILKPAAINLHNLHKQ